MCGFQNHLHQSKGIFESPFPVRWQVEELQVHSTAYWGLENVHSVTPAAESQVVQASRLSFLSCLQLLNLNTKACHSNAPMLMSERQGISFICKHPDTDAPRNEFRWNMPACLFFLNPSREL